MAAKGPKRTSLCLPGIGSSTMVMKLIKSAAEIRKRIFKESREKVRGIAPRTFLKNC